MKLDLSESRPGEFASLADEELRARARLALDTALNQITEPDRLIKAHPVRRGGEMQVIEDLSQLLVDAYRKRMARLQADVERILEEAP